MKEREREKMRESFNVRVIYWKTIFIGSIGCLFVCLLVCVGVCLHEENCFVFDVCFV